MTTAIAKVSKMRKKIDLEKLEKEYEDGDDDEELITDDELLKREMDKRKKQGVPMDGPMTIEKVRHQQSGSGPAVLFVEIDSTKWSTTSDELNKLAGIWQGLLATGGVHVSAYNVDGKLIVTIQKGWEGNKVKNFLMEREEVTKITWDQHDYFPNREL